MDYIRKINDILQDRNLSIRQLSFRCKLSETALHNILSYKSAPSVKTLKNICDALDIELVKMFCTDDELVVKNNETAARILGAFNVLSPETQNRLIWIADRLKGN